MIFTLSPEEDLEEDRKQIEEERAIRFRIHRQEATTHLWRETSVKLAEVGGLTGERGPVVDDLETQLSIVLIELHVSSS